MQPQEVEIVQFSNRSRNDRKLLREFVDFHWGHYRGDPQYVPMLDYEYLGSRLFGINGFFEPRSEFFKEAEMCWMLALRDGRAVGRCNAFVNRRHNQTWHDKVGFFGQFECLEEPEIAQALLAACEGWLKERGMEAMRGPQNQPVNEITPGLMTKGFEQAPMVYYPFSKPYYPRLLEAAGLTPIRRVFSWNVPIMTPMEEKLRRVAAIVRKRGHVTLEEWRDRPLKVRKQEMLDIYNEAWSENFGFVPFTAEEFNRIVDDMMIVMDKKFFVFAYVHGEAAGFMGVLPNVSELTKPLPGLLRRCEPLRAVRMILGLRRTRTIRNGYLGVKKQFRHLGLEGVMSMHLKEYSQSLKRLEYCDVGWILEENQAVIDVVQMMAGSTLAREFTIYQKPL